MTLLAGIDYTHLLKTLFVVISGNLVGIRFLKPSDPFFYFFFSYRKSAFGEIFIPQFYPPPQFFVIGIEKVKDNVRPQ